MTATVLSSHREIPPHGALGGNPGQTGQNHVERKNGTIVALGGNDEVLMAPGDIFVMETPGGGGYGKKEAAKQAVFS